MTIRNNISAINTNRSLNFNRNQMGLQAAKLSTGKRINSAADDAAGMSISQKMKAQIRGLSRASLNVQDAISLTQVADGAMAGLSGIMQRMRELAVQAANDVNADEDRMAIQKEIAQATEAIDEIVAKTNFNGRSLIDGGMMSKRKYHHGIRLDGPETQWIVGTTPASITSTGSIETPFYLRGGEPISVESYLVDLRELDPKKFPTSGDFRVSITDYNGKTISKTLDFGATSINTVSEFLSYFQNEYTTAFNNGQFAVEPKFEIDETTGMFKVTMDESGGASNITATGTAYSAIMGSTDSASTIQFFGFQNVEPVDGPIYTGLDDFFADMMTKCPDEIYTFRYWEPQDYSHPDDLPYEIAKTVDLKFGSFTSIGDFNKELEKYNMEIYEDRRGNIGVSTRVSTTTVKYTNEYGAIAERNISNRMSVEPDNTGFTELFVVDTSDCDNSIGSYNNVLRSKTPVLTSDYIAAISNNGKLKITVNDIPGIDGTKSAICDIDFSTFKPADEAALCDEINRQLNDAANVPVPPTTHPAPDPNFPVAKAEIKDGKLIITGSERGTYISVYETLSDKPMFNGNAYRNNDIMRPGLKITGTPFGTKEVKIEAGTYNSIDEFIEQNQYSFKQKGFVASKDEKGGLTITTIGGGGEFTITDIERFGYETDWFSKLGFSSRTTVDGTTTWIEEEIITDDNIFWVQAGANAKEGIYIDITSLNSDRLGLSLTGGDMLASSFYEGISEDGTSNYAAAPNMKSPYGQHSLAVSDHEKASQAIDIIDNALKITNTERARIGAITNRLEHTVSNLGVMNENLTASFSRIEDADMAKEHMDFIKNQILAQSGTAMLAQAKSMPESVLALLR